MVKERKAPDSGGIKIIAENRKARFNYHIIETFEAGMILTGAEIKSIRHDGITIAESYVRPQNGQIFLIGAHIAPYSHSGATEYDPIRTRKLLLHKHEIEKLQSRVEQKGLTIVPLKVYLKNGYAKIEIGLAKGKDAPDKRSAIKGREADRELARAIKGQKTR